MSCEKNTEFKNHLDSIDSYEYYSEEIIPADKQIIYGKWKVSGYFTK